MTSPPDAISPIVSFVDEEKGLVLLQAFGFQEKSVMRDDSGKITHSEVTWGSTVLMPTRREPGKPFSPGPACMYLTIDDPDALFTRLADRDDLTVVMELTDQDYGSRDFAVKDDSDNVWAFGTYRP